MRLCARDSWWKNLQTVATTRIAPNHSQILRKLQQATQTTKNFGKKTQLHRNSHQLKAQPQRNEAQQRRGLPDHCIQSRAHEPSKQVSFRSWDGRWGSDFRFIYISSASCNTWSNYSENHCCITLLYILYIYIYMGVSKNRGTPKWLVYNGKPY